MNRPIVWLALGCVLGAAGYSLGQQASDAGRGGLKRKVLMEQVLAEQIDGKAAKVTVLEIEKAPGAEDRPHRHPGPVFGYVLAGDLEMQVEGQPLKVLKTGETFYEPTGAVHMVGRSASKTEPVRFLAFLLTDKDQKELVLPAK
jgi:quercetin dioxygenase-like cupin family protein